jgi:hypothetical protein
MLAGILREKLEGDHPGLRGKVFVDESSLHTSSNAMRPHPPLPAGYLRGCASACNACSRHFPTSEALASALCRTTAPHEHGTESEVHAAVEFLCTVSAVLDALTRMLTARKCVVWPMADRPMIM